MSLIENKTKTIESFIKRRTNKTKVNRVYSDSTYINYGIPQGSLLGHVIPVVPAIRFKTETTAFSEEKFVVLWQKSINGAINCFPI